MSKFWSAIAPPSSQVETLAEEVTVAAHGVSAIVEIKDHTEAVPVRYAPNTDSRPRPGRNVRRAADIRQQREAEIDHRVTRVDAANGSYDRPPRGGLSAGALRKVKQHIEVNLDQNIRLDALAATAGLSVYHFARAFRQSVGMPPHRYLLQRRVEQAAELLWHTEQSLANIALSVGFSDQSHFSRSFVRLTGLTPRSFRKAHRPLMAEQHGARL